jgi:hypothetical protein
MAQNHAQAADLRLFRYMESLYAIAGTRFRIELRVWLQHFHFWCLQSDELRRGFSSR